MADDLHAKQSQPWYAMSLKKKSDLHFWSGWHRWGSITWLKRRGSCRHMLLIYHMKWRLGETNASTLWIPLTWVTWDVVNRNCPLTSTWICLLARTKMENRAGKDTRWVGNKGKEVYEVQCTKHCIFSHLFSFSNSCSCVLFFRLLLLRPQFKSHSVVLMN